jgi:hypothetical protein
MIRVLTVSEARGIFRRFSAFSFGIREFDRTSIRETLAEPFSAGELKRAFWCPTIGRRTSGLQKLGA